MADSALQPLLTENNSNSDIYGVNINSKPMDRTMYDNRGKYFDTFKFNQEFDNYIIENEKNRLKHQSLLLHDLNTISNVVDEPYRLSLKQILNNTQSMWFDLIDSGFKNFTYNYLFYMALTFITIALIYIMLYFIFL